MAMTGRNVDLVLGMTMKDFLDANKRAYVEYSKTKSQIEKNPVNLNVKGGKDFDMMSMRIASVGNAFQSLGSEIKPIIGLFNQSQMSGAGLAKAFVGLSDTGLRAFQMMSMLRVGVNGLYASLGPVGWVMIGITAVTTAFSLFGSSVDDAADKQEKFNKHFDKFADQLDKIKKLHDVDRLKEELAMTESVMLRAREENNKKLYEETLKYNLMIKVALKEIEAWELLRATGLTQKEWEELQKREAAQQKYNAMVTDLEDKTSKDQTKTQERLTANFKKEINKRQQAEEKATDKKEDFVDETINGYAFMESKGLATASILENAFVNQFQNGVPAMVAFGRAFEQMLAQMAISLASRAFIFGFLNMITGGSFGIGRSLLGFMGLGEVAGKASGGRITSSDVARSAFTPGGEDGLIGVQIGETVINRRATQMFAPVLDKLNEMGKYGYAKGGTVADGGMMPNASFNSQGLYDIVDAIRNIQINIKADLDSISFLRENYPKYQRIINKNRI